MRGFKNLVLNGIALNIVAQVAKQAVHFGATVALLRLLTPNDFGMIAMVTVFTGFVALFSELGLGAALIQKQDVEERHYSSVFWLNLGAGVALTGIATLAAPLITRFYDEPRLAPLVMLIAINFTIGPVAAVQITIFKKKMDFRSLALIETSSMTTACLVAVSMAYMGYGVYALAWQMLVQTSISSVLIWKMSSWHPRFLFQWSTIKELLRFSLNLMGLRFFSYWVRNADNLLIGKILGTNALGFYSRAYSTMLLPLNQITQVLGSVMFPALCSIKEDKRRVKSIYLNSIRSIALITFPLLAGLAVVADLFVSVLFGAKWEPMIPILRVLCIVGLFQSIAATTGWLYDSQGRTDLSLRWGLVGGILTFVAFGIGVNWGAIGVAIAYLIRVYATSYFHISIPGKLVGLSFKEVIRGLSGVSLSTVGMAMGVFGLRLVLPGNWPSGLLLALFVLSGAAIYWVLVHAFRVKAYGEGLRLVRERM